MINVVDPEESKGFRLVYSFPGLPLYCGTHARVTPKDKLLPFSLGVCQQSGTVIQVPNTVVQRELRAAYQANDLFLSAPIDESPLTRWCGDEFLEVMHDIARIEVRKKRILDIGCSTGYVLNELAKFGAQVEGCEPGPSARIARERYKLNVRQAFFLADLYDEQFDVVTHLTVLEHVEDPVQFLRGTAAVLREGGILCLGVPDCAPQLRWGDPGMILHEHWSYFTEESLKQTLRLAGFEGVQCHCSQRGVLYAWARRSRASSLGGVAEIPSGSSQVRGMTWATEYCQRFLEATQQMEAWLNLARRRNDRIAIYGASVIAANLWTLLDWSGLDVQLFDGDPTKHGRYVPGCPLPIQPPENLLTSLPERLLILPVQFTDPIRNFLLNELNLPDKTRVDCFADFLPENAAAA